MKATLEILKDEYPLKQGQDKKEFEDLCKQFQVSLDPNIKRETKEPVVLNPSPQLQKPKITKSNLPRNKQPA